ncbi:hypothetical protein GS485_17410 [Rhodococcus hoagii]|nr:hypothetical protein [Prescottella equi]
MTGGGKSPNWMTTLSSTPATSLSERSRRTGLVGLSLGVLTDQLKDRIMAFHSREDFFLAREAGPLRFHETFVSGQGTGCRWI